MPNDIQYFMEIDYKTFFTSLIIFMAGWVAIQTLLTKFSDATGIELPWRKREKEIWNKIATLKERVDNFEDETKSITELVSSMQETVEKLSETVTNLERKQDANEAAKLKDRISESYRHFHAQKEWTEMEKESFKDLIAAYTQYSQNSFVHEICEPESETWTVIDNNN